MVVSELAKGQCKASSSDKTVNEINEQSSFLAKLSKCYLNPVTVSVALVVGTMSTVANAWNYVGIEPGNGGTSAASGQNLWYNTNSVILAATGGGW